VTLESDVADYIQETISKNKGLKEKDLINKLLRSGMNTVSAKAEAVFKIEGFKSELQPRIDAATLEELLDEI